MSPSKDPFAIKDPFARRSVMASHFISNQPPLMASKFLSFFSDEAARDAEAHGHPHVPEPTYLTLILDPCLPLSRITEIVKSQIANLEPVTEECAKVAQSGEREAEGDGEGEEVKICRIRGAVKGWYNVFQDILTDEGDIYYLKRVMVTYRGAVLEAYRPTEHFPRPKTRKRKSVESTTPRSRSVVEGSEGRRTSWIGKVLHGCGRSGIRAHRARKL